MNRFFLNETGRLVAESHWLHEYSSLVDSVILPSIKIVENRIIDIIRKNKLGQEYSPDFIIKFCCETPEMKVVNSPIHINMNNLSYYVGANEKIFATKIVCFWDLISGQYVLSKIEGFHSKLGVFVIYRK